MKLKPKGVEFYFEYESKEQKNNLKMTPLSTPDWGVTSRLLGKCDLGDDGLPIWKWSWLELDNKYSSDFSLQNQKLNFSAKILPVCGKNLKKKLKNACSML